MIPLDRTFRIICPSAQISSRPRRAGTSLDLGCEFAPGSPFENPGDTLWAPAGSVPPLRKDEERLARAPYFANGSAQNLKELVDYYDRRFEIRLSSREKQDLINFLGVL